MREGETSMRAQLDQSVAGFRVVKRYRKLKIPLIDLVQSIHDLIPGGMTPGETITLKRDDGDILVTCDTKPVTLIIEDGSQRFELRVTKAKPKK